MGEEVSILSHEPEDADSRRAYEEVGVKILEGVKGKVPERGPSRCFFGPYVYDEMLGRRLGEVAGEYDVVVLVRPAMIQYVREASSATCVMADMVDDAILAERRELKSSFSPMCFFRRLKFLAGEYFFEKRYVGGIDPFIFVSEEDRLSFHRHHSTRHGVTIPNGVDTKYFSSSDERGSDQAGPTVMFLGNMVHSPNEEAALYLLDEIAPRIEMRVPSVKFVIVGSHPSKAMLARAGKNICITGWVADVRPYLRQASVVLLPMVSGTGIKNKLLEAWASGAAVVGSELVCQGVPAREGENILVGRTAAELADAAVRLIEDEDLRQRVGRQGRLTVEAQLTWETMAKKLMNEAARMLEEA
jgi:glycosyltransferase involved in cell wall biosynthesis